MLRRLVPGYEFLLGADSFPAPKAKGVVHNPPTTQSHLLQYVRCPGVALPEAHPMAALGRQLTLNDLDGQDVIMYSPVQARYFNELLISTFTIAGGRHATCST